MEISLSGKYRQLQKIFSRHDTVALAFSGGVDSSLLLYAACATLGSDRVHAFHARSELIPGFELKRVERIVQERGCCYHSIKINSFNLPEFVANGPARCYHCKKNIYNSFLAEQPCLGGATLFDGTNLDDLGQERPGLRAVSELKVQTPLVEAGLTKKEVRLLSREFALATWDAPSSSCLATRIMTGESIDKEKILLVAQCEEVLHSYGFIGVRVRLSQKVATIVLLNSDLARVKEKDVFSSIKTKLLSLGLNKVSLDPLGRSG